MRNVVDFRFSSLDKSFKAIAKAAIEARKALPPATTKAVAGADVKPVVKAPPVKDSSTVSTASKQRFKDEDFDSDYAPSRNDKS